MTLTFTVDGTPAPQGSKRYLGQKGGKGISVESNKRTAPWRADIRAAAQLALTDDHKALWDSPIAVEILFLFARPNAHYGTGRNAGIVKESAPHYHAQMPDIDKLARAVLDAMSGIVYADDKTICELTLEREWTEGKPGAFVSVRVKA